MSKQRKWGVHNCPNGLYYLRDVTDHSVYIHRNYGYLYSPYKEDIELVSTLLNELADKVDEQQATIEMYQRRVDKRERQIDIIKFHILNFCTDEQIQSIKDDLEIESKLRRFKK